MRDRYDCTELRDEHGNLVPFFFQASDLEYCKLLCPFRFARQPWSYQYLPVSYIGPLLDRSVDNLSDRLQEAKNAPHELVSIPNQPTALSRPIIYAPGRGGIEKVREEGYPIRDTRLRRLEHEFMASLIAASFEYAAKTIEGVSIEIVDQRSEPPFCDWPLFRLTTPTLKKIIYIEAETGSQSYTEIEKKIEAYLQLPDLKNTLVLFYATAPHRVAEMNERLKAVITRLKKPRGLAGAFGFTWFAYDRFLFKVPKLTTWAVTGAYTYPAGTFTLMGGTASQKVA